MHSVPYGTVAFMTSSAYCENVILVGLLQKFYHRCNYYLVNWEKQIIKVRTASNSYCCRVFAIKWRTQIIKALACDVAAIQAVATP